MLLLAACTAPPRAPDPAPQPEPEPALAPQPAEPRHDAIVVCGERFSIDAPVVLWTDAGGYDAYSTKLRFPEDPPAEPPTGLRYSPGRRVVKRSGATPALGALAGSPSCLRELQSVIDQFVVHYDVCGTSRTCFKVLHDRRKLSVHFMLDLDGTLYQTLDLADTAWHARQANPRSVGVEIANMGAYAPGAKSALDEWYTSDEHGTRVRLLERFGDGGLRTRNFIARPARSERIRGAIHGIVYEQHDLTPEQYDTLVKLTARLCELFPRMTPDAPRDAAGRVRTDELTPDEFEAYRGVLGHFHITEGKQDPGPAFDWEAFLARVRARLAQP